MGHTIMGHNSDNNQWISSLIELGLYFIIKYLCMKYESNIPMYSKDIALKPSYGTYVRTRVVLYAPPPPIKNGRSITKRHVYMIERFSIYLSIQEPEWVNVENIKDMLESEIKLFYFYAYK